MWNRKGWRGRLCAEIVALLDLPREASADPIVAAVLASMKAALLRGEEVRIPGFGIFAVYQTNTYQHYMPQFKARVTIPSRKYVRFLPSTVLTRFVNAN